MTEPKRHRWFQFSMSGLLILMLVVAAYLAGFATSQKLAEKAIEDASEKAAAEMEVARQDAARAKDQAEASKMLAEEAMSRAATALRGTRAQVP